MKGSWQEVRVVAAGGQPTARSRHGILPLLGGLAGLVALGASGYYAWNTWVVEALRGVDPGALLPSALFGLVAGAGSFFAPCAISLFPAYIAYYATTTTNSGHPSGLTLPRATMAGLACALGALQFFGAIGIALSVLGAAVGRFLIRAKPFLAAAIILAGLALLTNWRWDVPFLGRLLGHANVPGNSPRGILRGTFVYGFVYALASTGCTLPVYMAVVIFPFLEGHPLAGLVTLGGFGIRMGLFMLVTTALVGLSHQSLLRRIQAAAPWIKKGSGLVLIGAGAYLGYYYWMMGM
jgi:cytochrome c biogenesis protein CcdA